MRHVLVHHVESILGTSRAVAAEGIDKEACLSAISHSSHEGDGRISGAIRAEEGSNVAEASQIVGIEVRRGIFASICPIETLAAGASRRVVGIIHSNKNIALEPVTNELRENQNGSVGESMHILTSSGRRSRSRRAWRCII
jgi:hypothetical protein